MEEFFQVEGDQRDITNKCIISFWNEIFAISDIIETIRCF